LVEVVSSGGDGEAAQTVIPAEGNDDDDRFGAQNDGQAVETILGSVAADPIINNMVVVAVLVEESLESIGVAIAGAGHVAFSQAISKADDGGASVCSSIFDDWLRSCGSGCCVTLTGGEEHQRKKWCDKQKEISAAGNRTH